MRVCICRCAELYRKSKHPDQLQKEREAKEQTDMKRHLEELRLQVEKEKLHIHVHDGSRSVTLEGNQEQVFKAMKFMKNCGMGTDMSDGHGSTALADI